MFLPEDPDGVLDASRLSVVGCDEKGVVLSRPAVRAELRFRIGPLPRTSRIFV
jgi:hypothetical protein